VALRALAGLAFFPGNALAAASAKAAVSRTLPAINQRLTRCSRRSAASRLWVV
jgi:hypothetical protein